MKKLGILFQIIILFTSLSYNAHSQEELCKSGSQILPIDNTQVLEWKKTTPNQFEARAHIEGPVVRIDLDRNLHDHFAIQIGPNDTDTIEIISNQTFAKLPELQLGTKVEVCGDYITSNAISGRYLPSPDNAIIHWVHFSKNGNHDNGFIKIDSTLYGNGKGFIPRLEALELSKIAIKEPLRPDCFQKDGKGIILNPNYGKSKRPYKKVYGFVFDGTYAYKFTDENTTVGVPDQNKNYTLERFFYEKLDIDLEPICNVKPLDLMSLTYPDSETKEKAAPSPDLLQSIYEKNDCLPYLRPQACDL